MSVASAFLHDSDARRPILAIDAALQQIASAAHLRGVVVQRGTRVQEIPAADLMRALRGAWRHSEGMRRDQIEGLIRGTATRLQHAGPVVILAQSYGLARSVAGLNKIALASGARGRRR